MRIAGISLGSFTAQTQQTQKNETTQNPFMNAFKGSLTKDVFQNSQINDTQKTNFFAEKIGTISAKFTEGMNKVKGYMNSASAPFISFAGKVREGYNKLNSITLSGIYNNIKEEISLLSLDKDVRNYVKMPVSDLRTQLCEELNG